MVEGVRDVIVYHVDVNPTDNFTLPIYGLT